MQSIIEGIARFHKEDAPIVQPILHHLAMNGQSPQAMMITCADSRVMPEELTRSNPGDLFMVRNIGNLVPRPEDAVVGTDVSVGAAVDYGVDVLHIRNLVVMGHSGCGAMKALLDWQGQRDNIGNWLRNGRLALSRLSSDLLKNEELNECDRLSQINVLASLDNLSHYVNVRRGVENGQIELHGWWLDIANAQVRAYSRRTQRFETLEVAYAPGISSSAFSLR